MKTPSYSKALCIAAAVVTATPQASAFTQQPSTTVKPSLTSVQSSLASSIYFPGAMMGNNAVYTPDVPKQRLQDTPVPAPVPAPIAAAATPVRKTMELIDQFKFDATVIFTIIDSDASGSISKEEFSTHLQHAGSSEAFADDLFDSMDLNGDGAISEKEFQTLYLTVPSLRALPGMGQVVPEKDDDEQEISVNTYDQIIEAGDKLFRSLDVNGSGFIEFAELQAYMKSLSGSYQEKAMHKVFDLLDVDHDHGLNRHEFRDAYWRYSAFRNALGESPSS